MLGAIIGDIIGSPYEISPIKSKNFELFSPYSRPTDDTIMTIAVGLACVESNCNDEDSFKRNLINRMKQLGRTYTRAGYGMKFFSWLLRENAKPYNSLSNGSAMRVSPTAWAVDTLESVEKLAKWSAEVTHNHPEGIKGAQSVATAIFLARTGTSKNAIRQYISEKYYNIDFKLDDIRNKYVFDMTCQGSVPQAIECFLEANDYEDAIRNAISLGGDADTQAAIAGAIAEAFFGIPKQIMEKGIEYLDDNLKDFYNKYSVLYK